MKLPKAGTTTPKKLGKAGSKIIGHLDGVPVVRSEDPRKIIKLALTNSPDGNFIEFDDGERISLTDVEWRVELSRLMGRKHEAVDGTTEAGAV